MQLLRVPRRGCIWLQTFTVLLVLCKSGVFAGNTTKACKLSLDNDLEKKVLERLEPLGNNVFKKEKTEGKDSYTYMFQLCGDAGGVPNAGVIQVNNIDKKKTVIGLYNTTQAIGGSDWVMLIYGGGEKYDSHCHGENRRAIIMISCNKKVDMGNFEVILEHRDRANDCFYLFELDSSAVCPAVQSHLSAGSIILIIIFCLVAVYLIGGFLFQRLIVGAKGMEQFPNYAFWVEVGNLAADGCDFVCRSKNREGSPAYRGLSTEPVEEVPEERDDHLLPM